MLDNAIIYQTNQRLELNFEALRVIMGKLNEYVYNLAGS
jgi:hypothetical protein